MNALSEEDRKVLDTDYDRKDVNREAAGRYKLIQRGSMRLVMDLYRTEPEHAEFVEKALRIKLPGQKNA